MSARSFPVVCAVVVMALLGGLAPVAAQNPIQAAREAFRKAQEEARRKRAEQQPPPPQTASPSAPAPGAAGGNDATPGLSPADYSRLVASVGFTDVVGVKLGMTPEQALTAIKAANPMLTIDILRVDLEVGSRVVPTPKWAYAHGARRGPSTFNQDGSGEAIGLEFSLPPNPPVVIVITRQVRFANSAPVARSTLLEAFRAKYGPENVPAAPGSERIGWVFDETGKPVPGPLSSRDVGGCAGFDPGYGFPFPLEGAGQDTDAARTWTIVNEMSTRFNASSDYRRCGGVGPVIAERGVGAGDPKDVLPGFILELRSAALVYHSMAATNAFLKKAIEDEIKKEEDAGARRAAPKL